jgi:thiamine-phosphate pyrophosphorylase
MAGAGARWIQLRWKGASARELCAAATSVREALGAAPVLFVVNDRTDVALLAGAHGVHLGQDDLPPAAARRILGDAAIIGLSTHTLAQVEASREEPIDYIGFGPIFATASKRDTSPVVGLALLTEAAARSRVPVVAIGGIDVARTPEALKAGAHAVAMIGEVCGPDGTDAASRVARVLAAARGAHS